MSGLLSPLTSPTVSATPPSISRMVLGGAKVPSAFWRLTLTAVLVRTMRSGRLSWLTSTMTASTAFTGGGEDRGHIGESLALVVLEQAEATGVPTDQQVWPAVTVVVDGARGLCSDVEIESHGRGVDE